MRENNSGDPTPTRGRRDGPWPATIIAWLIETWPTGMSVREMACFANRLPDADRIYTIGAIVGKVRRLGLVGRPSPLDGKRRPPPRLILVQPVPEPPEPPEQAAEPEQQAPPEMPTCQYPHGARPDYRFCGQPTWSCTDPGRSRVYCQSCYRSCYTRHKAA